jgi:hypothetical protein
MVCLRNICVNTLHKGDSIFTNNNNNNVGFEGMDWIELAPERDRWRALVNAVMNLRVP